MKHLLSFKHFVRLLIAVAVLVTAMGTTSLAAAQSSCGTTYTVQRGDYLTKIARTCGVSYSDLLRANPTITNPSRIYPGQVINIPSGTIPVTGSKPSTYTVQQGDTLASIGQRFGLSNTELILANRSLGAAIAPGQVLNIPARIQFATGSTSAVVQGQLGANSSHYYLLNAGADQTLEGTLSVATSLTMAVYGADGNTVLNPTSNPGFRFTLPKSQDYVLVVTSGNTAVDYNLNVIIPARIQFAAGGTSATVNGTIPANLSQYYILRALQGQTMNVSATPQGSIQLIIYGVDGTVLKSGMGEGSSFSGVLPSTQDYILVLRSATQSQAFTLNVSIPAGSTIPVTGTGSYTVQQGDTLSSIARRFQTTVTALLRANPEISNVNVISVGQVIYLPGATIKYSNGQVVYVVKSGDTMRSIAQQFNVSLTALINANTQISNPNLILIGQRINIP